WRTRRGPLTNPKRERGPPSLTLRVSREPGADALAGLAAKRGPVSLLEGQLHDLAVGDRAEVAPGRQVNVVRGKVNRAVAGRHVDAAVVVTAGRNVKRVEVGAVRGLVVGQLRVIVEAGPGERPGILQAGVAEEGAAGHRRRVGHTEPRGHERRGVGDRG